MTATETRSNSFHWTVRGLLQKQSVVCSLLYRELGLSSKGNFHATAFSRQLFVSRCASYTGKSVKAKEVMLNQDKNNNFDSASSWILVKIPPGVSNIGVTDSVIWTRQIIGKNAPGSISNEEFYFVEPTSRSGLGLKRLGRILSSYSGAVKTTLVIEGQRILTSKNENHIQFITLVSPGVLRRFDLSNYQIMCPELRLPLGVCPEVTGYTEMDEFAEMNELYITGTDFRKRPKIILQLNRDSWESINIVRIDIAVKIIKIFQGVCCLIDNKNCLHVTTWRHIMQALTLDSTFVEPVLNCLPNVLISGKLEQFPETLCKLHLESLECFGLMEIQNMPMIYRTTKNAVHFFPLRKDPVSVYEYGLDQGHIWVCPLPDGAPRALITTTTDDDGKSEVVEFRSKWVENERFIESKTHLDAFNSGEWEKFETMRSSGSNELTPGGKRPKRACSMFISGYADSNSTILGIQYCPLLNLIGVLTGNDIELRIAMYEPLTLKMVKALPTVKFPNAKDSVCADFAFEPDYILVEFSKKTVFFMRLLTEKL